MKKVIIGAVVQVIIAIITVIIVVVYLKGGSRGNLAECIIGIAACILVANINLFIIIKELVREFDRGFE